LTPCGPFTEEGKFSEYELDVLIKQYRLEDFADRLAASVELLNRMLSMRLIEESREGIMKGMNIIVKRFPKIDDSFRRLALAIIEKKRSDMKQIEKPN
jgi:primosomal protein N''